MQKKEHFDKICTYFKSSFDHSIHIEFTMQTNGMLLSKEWIALLIKHQVGLGVSIDGPKEYHDKYRVDHFGRGTYDRLRSKIDLLMNSPLKNQVGALSVINPEFNPIKIYRHFVDDLGFMHMNFLLQDYNYDKPSPYSAEYNGRFLCDLFNEWIKDDNPEIIVSYFTSTINLFKGSMSSIYGIGPTSTEGLPLITIASNGDLSPVDELRNSNEKIMHSANVGTTTLASFLNTEPFNILKNAFSISPLQCQKCCWEKICGGGGIINRYSTKNGFDNPSIYCEGLKNYYSEVAAYMLRHHYSLENLQEHLLSIS